MVKFTTIRRTRCSAHMSETTSPTKIYEYWNIFSHHKTDTLVKKSVIRLISCNEICDRLSIILNYNAGRHVVTFSVRLYKEVWVCSEGS